MHYAPHIPVSHAGSDAKAMQQEKSVTGLPHYDIPKKVMLINHSRLNAINFEKVKYVYY
jgi:hypothetical protein